MPSDKSLAALAEQERARLANERMMADGIPPLDFIPQATPVGALKNRTAFQNQFSPEATNILERTPTNLSFAKEPAMEGTSGYYSPAVDPITSGLRKLIGNDPADVGPGGISVHSAYGPEWEVDTLAHEFAHKWQDQQLNPQTSWLWGLNSSGNANEYANDRVNSGAWEGSAYSPDRELYASTAEQGPTAIPAEIRNQFYPGMYRDNITQPQLPPAAQMQAPMSIRMPMPNVPDLQGLREQYFGAANWVPQQGVDGYTSHGTPIQNPRLGIPSINYYSSGYMPGEVRGG